MKYHYKLFRKQEAYKLPKEYVEDFANRMQLQIGEEEGKTNWFTRLTHQLQLRWSIPVLIVMTLMFFSIWLGSNSSPYFVDEEIEAYLLDLSRNNTSISLMNLAYAEPSATNGIELSDEELLEYLSNEVQENEIYLP
jgi:hypothetical protein